MFNIALLHSGLSTTIEIPQKESGGFNTSYLVIILQRKDNSCLQEGSNNKLLIPSFFFLQSYS